MRRNPTLVATRAAPTKIGSAKFLDEVFDRLNQAGIVGQILAGVLIEPTSLRGYLRTTFFALAELGVVFLLFRAGLEVKSSDLIKAGPTATAVSVLCVIVPYFAGWGLAQSGVSCGSNPENEQHGKRKPDLVWVAWDYENSTVSPPMAASEKHAVV